MEIEKTILEKQHEDIWVDSKKRAEYTLESVLLEGTPEEIAERERSLTSVEEARKGKHILHQASDRTMSRVLFITKDVSYLEKGSRAMMSLLNLTTLFDEIHIMVMVPLSAQKKTNRIVDNVWIYRVSSKFWWMLPFSAVKSAREQFVFNGGFRPDLVVALDPFESGLAALRIAHEFDRPYQVHVLENFLSAPFTKRSKGNIWRKRIAKYVLNRASSVRVDTGKMLDVVKKNFEKISDLQILPKFYHFKSYIEAKPSFDVHEKYKDYVFTILAFGPLTSDSHLQDTFSALNDILHNPRIGLIIIGNGSAKKLFEEKAELLGIKKNVVFVPASADLVSYLKTTDVFVQTDTSKESEEIVLKAAASGLPLIMYETEMRNDLFEDGVSATLCEAGDVHTLAKNVSTFINNTGLRLQYKTAAQEVVKTRLQEDEVTYYRAFRDSIELAFTADDKTEHDNGKT